MKKAAMNDDFEVPEADMEDILREVMYLKDAATRVAKMLMDKMGKSEDDDDEDEEDEEDSSDAKESKKADLMALFGKKNK